MDNSKLVDRIVELETAIEHLKKELEDAKQRLKRNVPRRESIVVSGWKGNNSRGYRSVHFISNSDKASVLNCCGVSYDLVSDDIRLVHEYTDHIVLTKEEEQKVFDFILEIADNGKNR